MIQDNLHTYTYGNDEQNQYIRLHTPSLSLTSSSSSSLFIIIHGGYWKSKYGIDNSAIETLAPFLVNEGHAVCLIEYRRCGQGDNGGWPNTNNDIIAALRRMHAACNDLNMIINKHIIVGHSAGGTLALWCSCLLQQRDLPFGIALCVAIAPIGDLEEGQRRRLSDDGDAIQIYLGGKLPADDENDVDDPYKQASPSRILPLMVPCILVAGAKDEDVPSQIVQDFHLQCMMAYSNANTNNDMTAPDLLIINNADHYQLMNAEDPAWKEIYNLIKINHLQKL